MRASAGTALMGRVAVVTGAARGQGAAIAQALRREGAAVGLADVLDGEGRRVAHDMGDRGTYYHLDVADEVGWKSVLLAVTKRYGGLDILVNNAGVTHDSSIEGMSLAEYRRVIDVNQVGCWLGMREALPHMRRRGGGAIVNNASSAGLVPLANRSAYVASKFAVRGMSRAAALEFGSDNIRVNTIFPGAIDTPINDTAALTTLVGRLPIARIGTVEDIAALVLFLVSDAASYLTGSEITVDGGLLAGMAFPP